MVKSSILIIDKRDSFGVFRCEQVIKSSSFRENVDYNFERGKYNVFSPDLIREILFIQNPYSDVERDVSDLDLRVLVDHGDEINVEPQIVKDFKKGKKVISKGRSDSQLLVEDNGGSSQVQEIDWDKARENKVIDTEMPDYSDMKLFTNNQKDENVSNNSHTKTISSFTFVSLIVLFFQLLL